jgi:GTPase SAR1 family protein
MFTGLANAGKTSMLLALDDKIAEVGATIPTVGVAYSQISYAGFNITTWDIGGQIDYRKKAILEYDHYFANVGAIFFVISVEEPENFKDAIEFLKEIVKITDIMKLDAPIAVCLHKFDPYRRQNVIALKNLNTIKGKVEKVLKKRRYKIYQTSIYEPSSIKLAFSETIQRLMPQYNLLQDRMQAIAGEFGSAMNLILDENSKIIAEWHAPDYPRVNLTKFGEFCINLSHMLSRRIYPEFILLNMNENAEIAAVPFCVYDKVFVGFLQADTGTLDQGVIDQLLRKREEFGQLLSLFQSPSES